MKMALDPQMVETVFDDAKSHLFGDEASSADRLGLLLSLGIAAGVAWMAKEVQERESQMKGLQQAHEDIAQAIEQTAPESTSQPRPTSITDEAEDRLHKMQFPEIAHADVPKRPQRAN